MATHPRPTTLDEAHARAGAARAFVRVRRADRLDEPLVEAMLLRTRTGLPSGRHRRGVRARREARRRLDGRRETWVAIAAGGVRGVATVDPAGGDDAARAVVVVEDDWRRCGIGRALAAALCDAHPGVAVCRPD